MEFARKEICKKRGRGWNLQGMDFAKNAYVCSPFVYHSSVGNVATVLR